jgi:molybdopterin-guanine dinucleotide biosynthesis protein A
MAEVTIVLLAGGAATRLPGKLALPVNGEPMLVHVYRRLTADGTPCILSVRDRLDPRLADLSACEIVTDEISDGGPLGAILSCARKVRTPLFVAVAGDLPDIDSGFIAKLLKTFHDGDAAGDALDAVLPTWTDGKVEPLAALYATAPWIGGAERALAAGHRKVTAALDGLKVAAYRVTAADERMLANVNTPEDYERAVKISQ